MLKDLRTPCPHVHPCRGVAHLESRISNNSKHELAITALRVPMPYGWFYFLFGFPLAREQKFEIEIKKHADFFYIDESVMYT